MQYVYLIRLREFRNSCQKIYKIGKTTLEPNTRLAGYPKGSEVYLFLHVFDSSLIERRIIALFRTKYILRKDIGREYFEGDSNKMMNDMWNVSREK